MRLQLRTICKRNTDQLTKRNKNWTRYFFLDIWPLLEPHSHLFVLWPSRRPPPPWPLYLELTMNADSVIDKSILIQILFVRSLRIPIYQDDVIICYCFKYKLTGELLGKILLVNNSGLVASCSRRRTVCWRPACCWLGWGSVWSNWAIFESSRG